MTQYYKTSLLFLLFFTFITIACSSSNTVPQAQSMNFGPPERVESPLSLSDIWSTSKYSSKYVWGINLLNDGKSYSSIDKSSEMPVLKKYNLSTGEVSEVLFEGSKEVYFTDYQLSDDEQKIILATNREGVYRYSIKADNYIYDIATKTLTKLHEGEKQLYPSFSPDGTKVSYIVDNNIYYKDLNTGETVAVTNTGKKNELLHGMSDWVYEEEFALTHAYKWSPDSQQIAYFSFDEREVPLFNIDFYGSLYPQLYTFKYPKAGEKNSIVYTTVYDVKSREQISVTTGQNPENYYPRLFWTPTNDLIVTELNRLQNHLKLWKVNWSNGKSNLLYDESNEKYISEMLLDQMKFLKDGRFVVASERTGYNHLYLYDKQGKLIHELTSGKWDVTKFYGVDEANGKVFFQAAQFNPLERELYSVDIDGSELTQLSKNKGNYNAEFTKTFDYYVEVYSNAITPPITSVVDRTGTLVRELEDNSELKAMFEDLNLPKHEFFDFKTVDGTTLNGWMLKPINFDEKKKYPLLIYVYGGPGSQTVQNSWAIGDYWWHSYFTQQGYIVVSVDNRGTGARGEDFKKSTYKQLGNLEVQDQTAAAKFLGKKKYIDENRIGIWGWSYGGYMSSNCLFQSNDVFKAAVAVSPVTNWRYYDTVYTERYMRTPQENPQGYDLNSPIHYADKLKGKFLLVHGTGDDNVHFQNTVDLVTSLNESGKQYDLAIYPNKKHGIYGGITRYQLFEKITEFFMENL